MAEEARSQGAEVKQICVHSMQIHPCTGCMSCRTSGKCHLSEDDAQRTLHLIEESDALIIGSPCYWGNMNGHLKMLFDRMVYGLIGEGKFGIPSPKHKGKRAAIVTTSTTRWPFNILYGQTSGTVRALKQILKYSGFHIEGIIQKGNTRQCTFLTSNEKKKCRNIIRKMIS